MPGSMKLNRPLQRQRQRRRPKKRAAATNSEATAPSESWPLQIQEKRQLLYALKLWQVGAQQAAPLPSKGAPRARRQIGNMARGRVRRGR